jgi:hypothetical protein
MFNWIKPAIVGVTVLALLFLNGLPRPLGGAIEAQAATWPWTTERYSFNSAQEQGWRVQTDVVFDNRWTRSYPYPSIRGVQVNCWVPWAIFYRVEILECSRNYGGAPTITTMNGRWVSIYRPGVRFRACFGIKDLGEICGTFASVKPVHNYWDNDGGYTLWATQHRSF